LGGEEIKKGAPPPSSKYTTRKKNPVSFPIFFISLLKPDTEVGGKGRNKNPKAHDVV